MWKQRWKWRGKVPHHDHNDPGQQYAMLLSCMSVYVAPRGNLYIFSRDIPLSGPFAANLHLSPFDYRWPLSASKLELKCFLSLATTGLQSCRHAIRQASRGTYEIYFHVRSEVQWWRIVVDQSCKIRLEQWFTLSMASDRMAHHHR